MSGRLYKLLASLLVIGAVACAAPPPAGAVNVVKPVCTVAGLLSGIAGKLCTAASHAEGALKAGQKLLGGHLGGALKSLLGGGTAAKAVGAGLVLASIAAWVTGGAKFVLQETAKVISTTTRPQLQSTWFSASYWRMAALSALLTLPFLFAAAIQALIRSDPALLARSTLVYLPLGMLAVAIAAPVTMLLLSASDEMSAIVSGAAGSAGGNVLGKATFVSGSLTAVSGSTFLALFLGLLTVAATVTLWVELLVRSAAVYVVVLMLPLFFAAFVWPARRIWAVRAVELLVALILSKFVIVAVLSLGGAALGHTTLPAPAAGLSGVTLVMLAAFSPWALLRLLPLHELAGGLESLRDRSQFMASSAARADEISQVAQSVLPQLPPAIGDQGPLRDESGPAEAAVRGLQNNDSATVAGTAGGAQPPGSAGRGAAGDAQPPGSAGRGAAGDAQPAAPSGEQAAGGQPATAVGEGPAAGGTEGPSLAGGGIATPASQPAPAIAEPSQDSGPGPVALSMTEEDGRPPMEPLWNAPSGGWRVLHLPTPPSQPPIGPDPDQPAAPEDPTPSDTPSLPPAPEDGDL